VILACVVLTQYRSVTEGRTGKQTERRTDAQAMAKTREALHAVARKNFDRLSLVNQMTFTIEAGHLFINCQHQLRQASLYS